MIINKADDFVTQLASSLSKGTPPSEFIQLTRDLAAPGELMDGRYEFSFNFKNVDLDLDSYCGIAMDVRFEVTAVMEYEGAMMNYTA